MKLKSPSFAEDFDDLVPPGITEICIALFTDKIVIESLCFLAANCEVLLPCGKLEIQPNYQLMFLEMWPHNPRSRLRNLIFSGFKTSPSHSLKLPIKIIFTQSLGLGD